MYVHAIPVVESTRAGIDVLWSGPVSWVYAPGGWVIRRRRAAVDPEVACETLTTAQLDELRQRRSLRVSFGVLRLGRGPGPIPVGDIGGASKDSKPRKPGDPDPTPLDIVTLELDEPRAFVRAGVTQTSWAYALSEGKVVAEGGGGTGANQHDLRAPAIDTVVLYARDLSGLRYCFLAAPDDEASWASATIVARRNLPLRELMPELTSFDAELAEARSRLLTGEAIAEEEFRELTDLLRPLVQPMEGRAIDRILLPAREDTDSTDEIAALDPLRAALVHPRWMRALGFSIFDRDPQLVRNQMYEYRVTGTFPAADLVDRVHGFHTVPGGTPLPDEFALDDLQVRISQPSEVGRAHAPSPTSHVMTRRGVALTPERRLTWLGFGIEGWSAVLDFPQPVFEVTLELGDALHTLTYAGGWPGSPMPAPRTVPASTSARLSFSSAIEQLRLGGRGFLCAVRDVAEPPRSGNTDLSLSTPPVTFASSPVPPPPLAVSATSLQAPSPVLTTVDASTPLAPRHALGLEVTWQPAPPSTVVAWPVALPPPPTLASMFQIDIRGVDPTTDWSPLLDGDNLITGHRQPRTVAPLVPGADLMLLFPELERPEAGTSMLIWRDVFDAPVDDDPGRRPPPPPGTRHQYRVRAVDVVGRRSTWHNSNVVQLRKHVPPPLPVGLQARVLVPGAPDLAPADLVILGNHASAIVLRWGWYASQREQDPYATEFRVYTRDGLLDAIDGQIVAAAPLSPHRHEVSLVLAENITADVARGLRIDGSYPFEIETHTGGAAGATIVATLVARVPQAGGPPPVPAVGAVRIPVRVTPDRTRAPAWRPRRQVVPITSAEQYEVVLYDRFELSADDPDGRLLVGVSTADSQAYATDPLAPDENRPGNESPIAALECRARWRVAPTLTEAPSLTEVPELLTAEPHDRPLEVELDLTPLLDGTGLGAGDRVYLERAPVEDLYGAYRTADGRIWARPLEPIGPGDAEAEVAVPAPSDRAAIVAALSGSDVNVLADRHAVFLAASHPHRSRLFQPIAATPVLLPRVRDALPGKGGRWLYRARRANAAGNMSADGRTLRGVVRVPSTGHVMAPTRDPAAPGDAPHQLRLRVDGRADVTQVLWFSWTFRDAAATAEGAELLRVPGTTGGLRLRLADGTLLTSHVKELSDGDVEQVPPDRRFLLSVPGSAGDRIGVWTCAVTRDGVPSPIGGPWRITLPPPQLLAPSLSVSGGPAVLTFQWNWNDPTAALPVVLEASRDGTNFDRVSPRLAATVSTLEHRPAPEARHFRIRVLGSDGRTAASNLVTP